MITTKKICLEDTQIKMRKGSKHVTIKFNKTQYKTARERKRNKRTTKLTENKKMVLISALYQKLLYV